MKRDVLPEDRPYGPGNPDYEQEVRRDRDPRVGPPPRLPRCKCGSRECGVICRFEGAKQ